MDFCAGAGGKSLAFGPFLKVSSNHENQGQIYLHDIREMAIQEAKRRFARSGMENAQFHVGEKTLKNLRGKMDWVVVDVPCTGIVSKLSGTGTIRRNPDLKWKFSDQVLENLVKTQRGGFLVIF